MELEIQETLKEDFAMAFSRLVEYFDYNYEKILHWFYTPNFSLGGGSAYQMILDGRTRKLITFINSQLDENIRNE